jgi:single-strand DNA-binding protein
MSFMNLVIFAGNLGGDPEVKNVGNSVVTTFSVATTETYKDKSTGEKKSNTDWHNCVAWGRTAEFIGKYAHKGTKALIKGSLHYKTYENKDGNKVTKAEIKLAPFGGFTPFNMQKTSESNHMNFAEKYTNKVTENDEDNIPF